MKLAIGIIVVAWLLCGVAGARMLGDLDTNHLDMIARGPITLVQAWNEQPVPYPQAG